MKRLVVSGCMGLILAGMGGISLGAPSSTHAITITRAQYAQMQECFGTGWKSVTASNGVHFANEGACLMYVYRGGNLI